VVEFLKNPYPGGNDDRCSDRRSIRTPIGALGGTLARVRPDDLGAAVLKALVDRNHLDAQEIEEVYLGCANQAGEDNRNVARMSSLLAGIPASVAAVTVNRLCASGLTP